MVDYYRVWLCYCFHRMIYNSQQPFHLQLWMHRFFLLMVSQSNKQKYAQNDISCFYVLSRIRAGYSKLFSLLFCSSEETPSPRFSSPTLSLASCYRDLQNCLIIWTKLFFTSTYQPWHPFPNHFWPSMLQWFIAVCFAIRGPLLSTLVIRGQKMISVRTLSAILRMMRR